jgi:hypothetical protein
MITRGYGITGTGGGGTVTVLADVDSLELPPTGVLQLGDESGDIELVGGGTVDLDGDGALHLDDGEDLEVGE